MIKYKSNCSVCKLIKTSKKGRQIANRIYDSKFYNPTGEESIMGLAKSLKVSRASLTNHVKKHQFISQSDLDQHRMQKMVEKSEKSIIEKVIKHEDVRNKVMSVGMEKLEEGEIRPNVNNMLTAARDQMNYEQKKADQQIKLQEMIWFYASEEAKTPGLEGVIDGQATEEPIGSDNEGQVRSSPVHERTAWDGPPPRPNTIPPRNS
jgi:hypothetical protein